MPRFVDELLLTPSDGHPTVASEERPEPDNSTITAENPGLADGADSSSMVSPRAGKSV